MTNLYLFFDRRLFKPIWFAIALLVCTTAFAQNTRYTIKGRVVDPERQPLPGTTVVLVGTTLGTTTDADGNYSLLITGKPGSTTVAFSAIGYDMQRQAITLGNADQITVDVELAASPTNLD